MFYQVGQINPDHSTTYTAEEARALLLEHEMWGPWADAPEGVDPVFKEGSL